jgi:anthranilate synthase component II
MQVLIIDNYDSFTYNLFQYFKKINGNPFIIKNNKISLEEIKKLSPDRIVISPGPGTAEDSKFFGICKEVILKLGPKIPLLGVCLGHQGIIHAFSGKIISAPKIFHGKTSQIFHNNKNIFKNIKNPFTAMRYHSLIASHKNFPKELEITATLKDKKTIMGVCHKKFPIFGIQFHPESFMTPEGEKIIKNFISLPPFLQII